MRPRTSFDRTTAKLFVAAFFVLGGLECMDLHAQTFCGGGCDATSGVNLAPPAWLDVAISNSSPASETTSHVDEAVDATTLF